ncbi:MAG: peptidoglycan-binding protein [Symploca sp. SIO3E6]|nr:peptidoglycan-binding protein [Caldora sp. SIO3E6]
METLAYIHLALADEVTTGVGASERVDWRKFSSQALILLLPVITVAFGILGMANETLAQQAKRGDNGSNVRQIQERLREEGYFNRQPTGFFREITERSVKNFQRDNGLRVDGIVGVQTEAVLFYSRVTLPPPAFPFNREPIFSPPNSGNFLPREDVTQLQREDVRQLQIELLRNGFDPGPIDGIYGPLTRRAVIDFQISKGLPVTGVADQRTLQALGILQPEEKRYTVIVPGDDNTLEKLQRYLQPYLSDIRWNYVPDDRRGGYVKVRSFDNRNDAESWSYWLRARGFDARVVYF